VAITYREARVGDVEAMDAARTAGGWAGGAGAPVMARYLAGTHHPQQARPPRVAFLAEDGGTVVGFAAGHLTRRFGCDGEAQWLFAAPQRRGGEVAAALLSRLARWFVAQGARRVCVNVAPENARARAFYARSGARELNEYWLEWPDMSATAASGAPAGAVDA
jgi:GNAT superfamily N-acetyltransferase